MANPVPPGMPMPTGPVGQPMNILPGQGMPSAQLVAQQQASQQIQEQKLDNISKVKALMWPLRDSLANVMRVSAQNFYQNCSMDSSVKVNDQAPPVYPRFDKTLEEFYAICDQIELNLKTTGECVGLAASGQRYSVPPVLKPDPTNAVDPVSYSQLITTVKSQVAFAREVHDTLAEAARIITAGE